METNHARRRMLRGHLSGVNRVVRPPWALTESLFTEQCSRCDECVDACPPAIIKRASGGFPEVDFTQGECDFCGKCEAACQPKALHAAVTESPWHHHIEINSERCLPHQGVMCLSCAEQCEPEAIRFAPTLGGVSKPQLESEQCTGCGACIGSCPNGAITMKIIEAAEQLAATGEQCR